MVMAQRPDPTPARRLGTFRPPTPTCTAARRHLQNLHFNRRNVGCGGGGGGDSWKQLQRVPTGASHAAATGDDVCSLCAAACSQTLDCRKQIAAARAYWRRASGGGGARVRLTFRAPPPRRGCRSRGVSTERDGSITAAIRHQTKGPTGGRGAPPQLSEGRRGTAGGWTADWGGA